MDTPSALILAGLRNAASLVLEETDAMPLLMEPITDPLFLDLIRKDRIEGEALGEARALIRLTERRFSPLPADIHQRILSADSAAVESLARPADRGPKPGRPGGAAFYCGRSVPGSQQTLTR
jgi:hypothetical protein